MSKLGRQCGALSGTNGIVFTDVPLEVVYEEFENDRLGSAFDGYRPEIRGCALHWRTPIPTQTGGLATHEQIVAESDVDPCRNGCSRWLCGGRDLLFDGHGVLHRRKSSLRRGSSGLGE